MLYKVAKLSLLNRKGSVLLTILAIATSIYVMLAVEHIKQQAKTNFTNSVSGVDLIVGARTSDLNLLLYSVFRIGSPTNNISWQSYRDLANHQSVKWAVPLSLGDSHKGYRVLGTTPGYFSQFSYGDAQALNFKQGQSISRIYDVVLGYEVAKSLNYQIGDSLFLSHGLGSTSFKHHDEFTFTVVGILSPTGTPVDQTVHTTLEGLEAVHQPPATKIANNIALTDLTLTQQNKLQPDSVTAVLVGLTSRIKTFSLQRQINTSSAEPLLAILPGATLAQLWHSLGTIEKVLQVIAILVLVAAILGLSAMMLSSIRERQREIQLLRMIGASYPYISWLIALEALLITLVACIAAITLLLLTLFSFQDLLLAQYGLSLSLDIFTSGSFTIIASIFGATILAVVPGIYQALNKSSHQA